MLVAGSAGVQSLVGGTLYILNGEGSIVDALSHVSRQPHIILLPDDTVDRITGHGTLDGELLACDGRDSCHRANVGHAWEGEEASPQYRQLEIYINLHSP